MLLATTDQSVNRFSIGDDGNFSYYASGTAGAFDRSTSHAYVVSDASGNVYLDGTIVSSTSNGFFIQSTGNPGGVNARIRWTAWSE